MGWGCRGVAPGCQARARSRRRSPWEPRAATPARPTDCVLASPGLYRRGGGGGGGAAAPPPPPAPPALPPGAPPPRAARPARFAPLFSHLLRRGGEWAGPPPTPAAA